MSRIAKAVVLSVGAAAAVAGATGIAAADAGAEGAAVHSPGVLSGNVVQAPIHVPVNVCGNTVNVIGALNPSFGNTCVNA
ncbi:chaplin [Streptomyces sp. NPDC090025]|uniref:chaplin n=1 Tax=Streptomyces sp. NPDC090025 TaxID=3365922 RepID=UPI0038398288